MENGGALMFSRSVAARCVSVYHAACKSVPSGFSYFRLLIFAPTAVHRWFYIFVLNHLGCLTVLMLNTGARLHAGADTEGFDQASLSTITGLYYLYISTGLNGYVCEMSLIPVLFTSMQRASLQKKLSSCGEEM